MLQKKLVSFNILFLSFRIDMMITISFKDKSVFRNPGINGISSKCFLCFKLKFGVLKK